MDITKPKRLTIVRNAVVVLAIGGAASATAQEPTIVAPTITIESIVLRPMVEAEVPARQTGVIEAINVAEGNLVEQGAQMIALDARAAQLAVAQARKEVEQAAAALANELAIEYADKALEVARAELARSLESNEQFPNSISDSQLDVERLTIEKLVLERQQAEHDIELQRFELQLKEISLEAATLELELHHIRAPFAGVVALVRGRVGEWVEPGDAVLRLVGVDRLRAEGFAPAGAASDALVGAHVQFTLASNDAADEGDPVVVEGVVRFVSPEVDPVNGQVRVWAEIDNADRRLRPGQQGELRIDAGND